MTDRAHGKISFATSEFDWDFVSVQYLVANGKALFDALLLFLKIWDANDALISSVYFLLRSLWLSCVFIRYPGLLQREVLQPIVDFLEQFCKVGFRVGK